MPAERAPHPMKAFMFEGPKRFSDQSTPGS